MNRFGATLFGVFVICRDAIVMTAKRRHVGEKTTKCARVCGTDPTGRTQDGLCYTSFHVTQTNAEEWRDDQNGHGGGLAVLLHCNKSEKAT